MAASPAGSIHGIVRDPSGLPIHAARLDLAGTTTPDRRTAASDTTGAFQFVDLRPGLWSVQIDAPGFRRVHLDVLVQVDRATTVDVRLELGERTDVVNVATAIAPGLEKARPTFQTLIDSRAIAEMPLNGRQYLDLALLAGGATPAAPGTQGSGFSVAGIRSQSNVYLLDGVANIDTQTNQPLNLFRITDGVREFAVQSAVPLPEFGRGAGAQVNVVTKSGSNSVHGSAFEYLRNTVLNSSDFFTNKLGGTKSVLNRNQFGATAGAPIRRDRTFVFASYEGFRQVAPAVSSTVVPTPQQAATVTDPISRRLLAFYPAPNAAGSLNYVANVRNLDADDTALLRLDHRATDRDQLSARWTEYWGTSTAAGPTPLTGGSQGPLSQVSATLAETHTFSAATLNELRLGFSRYGNQRSVQDQGFDAGSILTDATGAPLPGVPRNAGLPSIAIGGGFAALGSNANFPQGRTSNTVEAFDNFSHIAGRHTLRAGAHVRREDLSRFLDRSARGSINFANFADFARGQLNAATIRTGSTQTYWRNYPWDLYFEDEFRVRENLIVTFGLRYEYPSAIEERRGRATTFVPGVGPMIAGTNRILDIDTALRGPASLVYRSAPFTLPSAGVYPDRNNFAPMLGFAWTPSGGKTVIRGGARLAYDELFNNVPSAMGLAAPMSLQTTQTANVTQPAKFAWPLAFDQSVPLVSNGSGILTFQGVDPHIRSAQAYIYLFSIQRQVGGMFFEAAYQGSQGRHLGMFVDANQPFVIVRDATKRGPVAPNVQLFPYPNYGQSQVAESIGNSHYDGVTLTARRATRHRLAFQGSYTFGKSLDYNSSFFGSGNQTGEPGAPIDARNLRLEHGPSAFDVRHRFAAFFTLDLPWRWKLAGIATLQTGSPFTIVTGGQDTSGFNQSTPGTSPDGGNRPNLVRAAPLPQDNRNPDAAFDPSWFAPNLAGQDGTSGRNQYYGPGLQNYNLSIARTFGMPRRWREQARLEARGDFFNLLNHTNFANPVADLSNANFGRITQTLGSAVVTSAGTSSGPTGGPRIVQVSLRFQF